VLAGIESKERTEDAATLEREAESSELKSMKRQQ
jgi:hypothetical protein